MSSVVDGARDELDELRGELRDDFEAICESIGCAESCETDADFHANLGAVEKAAQALLNRIVQFREEHEV